MKNCMKRVLMLALLMLLLSLAVGASAEDGITQRINNLRAKFPEGMYWNHQRQVAGDDGDTLLSSWNNSYGDYVSYTPCATHNGVAAIGQYDCNAFDGAIQCYGFANKVFYDIFGQYCSAVGRRTDTANVSVGDHIRLYTWGDSGHSAVVIARNGNTLTVVEGNYSRNCMIHWDRTVDLSSVVGFYHATNWDQVYNDYGVYIDVNGELDGELLGTLDGYGTFDVYINGSCVADDVSDYYVRWPVGTTYSITDIRAKDGYQYESVHSGAVSGALGSVQADVRLSFTSLATLDVDGLLDSVESEDAAGFGTFDVYINGVLSAENVSDYNRQWPQGTAYEIRNVQAVDGKHYNGAVTGEISGVLGKGAIEVTLAFSTIIQAGSDWREEIALPEYIDPATVEIEYKNYYEMTAENSPGAGWTQVAGSGETSYVDNGGIYDSDFALATSDTRIHVGTYYYHYCYSGCSDVEHYNDGVHTVYHNVGDINQYYTDWEGPDSLDSRYMAYRIKWASGQWADGYAYCSLGSPAIYYRRYQYQDRTAITTYKWVKESDWGATTDESAASVKVRFRLKQYEVTFDANGGESAPAALIKYHGIDLKLPEAIPEKPAFGFAGWNTQADGKGAVYAAGDVYADNSGVTLFAQWEPLARVVLPADLKIIEERAFENVDAVIIEIPDGCESIGEKAFLNCRNLVQLHIPATVNQIAFDAFDGCSELTIYAPAGSTAIRFAGALGIPYEIAE